MTKRNLSVTIGFINLGCTKNQVDSEVMQGILLTEGYSLVKDVSDADVIVVNTCGFIQAAKEESVETILEAAKFKERRCKVLVVAGCLSQRYANDLLQEIPEIDAMVGTDSFIQIADVVEKALAGERRVVMDGVSSSDDLHIHRTTDLPYSAYVKIAEGCDNRCSYCAIPLIRGGYRSRSMESIVDEVRNLAERGVKEINLVAQDTTRYGLDIYGRLRLPDLLVELLKISGPRWYRLLYCYPAHITDELLGLMATEARIVKYIDLPLQHISDKILNLMGRKPAQKDIKELLTKMRRKVPGLAIRTTFIVGFPGEEEGDFAELYEFVQETGFDHLGVFKYSIEEDTGAADMQPQVPEEIKEDRYHRLMSLQKDISLARNERYIGTTLEVLVEEVWEAGEGITGRASKDAPEVDGVVYVSNCDAEPGDFVKAYIEDVMEYDLLGVSTQ